MILGIDPGTKSPHYAVGLDRLLPRDFGPCPLGKSTPAVYTVSPSLPGGRFDHAAVEGQYPNPKSSRQSLITLSFNAGWRIGQVDAVERYCLSPVVWKPLLWRGSMTKAVFCNRILANLTSEERELLPTDDTITDALDAIGIMWALYLCPEKVLKKCYLS